MYFKLIQHEQIWNAYSICFVFWSRLVLSDSLRRQTWTFVCYSILSLKPRDRACGKCSNLFRTEKIWNVFYLYFDSSFGLGWCCLPVFVFQIKLRWISFVFVVFQMKFQWISSIPEFFKFVPHGKNLKCILFIFCLVFWPRLALPACLHISNEVSVNIICIRRISNEVSINIFLVSIWKLERKIKMFKFAPLRSNLIQYSLCERWDITLHVFCEQWCIFRHVCTRHVCTRWIWIS